MLYTVLTKLHMEFDKYLLVEADSEEEAIQKVEDAEVEESFIEALTEDFDQESIETEAYICEFEYDHITTLDDILNKGE